MVSLQVVFIETLSDVLNFQQPERRSTVPTPRTMVNSPPPQAVSISLAHCLQKIYLPGYIQQASTNRQGPTPSRAAPRRQTRQTSK